MSFFREFEMPIHDFPDSLAVFKDRFHDVLAKMLMTDELGAFILVLANSLQDESLQRQLTIPLKEKYQQLKKKMDNAELQPTKDDADVFAALGLLGLAHLSVWQSRTVSPWTVVYNTMRALRPARSSGESITTLQRPFDADAFHFNKPFLAPEMFWQGKINAVDVQVFYNKFPFAPYHLLIVPDVTHALPQFLTVYYHAFIWDFVAQYAQGLEGLGVAYNSLGAYASINQLHFQGFIQTALLPIEDKVWEHNEGDTAYPMLCHKLTDVTASWRIIKQLHQSQQAYNLLYRKGCCYIVVRMFQGEVTLPEWMQGMAWCEVCGVQTVGDSEDFSALQQNDIKQVLGSFFTCLS